MEKIPKADFVAWARHRGWLLVGEVKYPLEGYQQENYLTPSGSLVLIIYDKEGNLFKVGNPPPPMPQQMPQQMPMQRYFPLPGQDPRGGQNFHP